MSSWITVEVDRALYVDRGRNVILCEGPMSGPHTLVLKLKEAEMTKTPVEAAQGHLQSRGRHYDIIREAISAYDEYMLDDDYDAQGTLDKIIKKMRERVDMAAAPVEESEPKSAFACPICGSDKPHHHYPSEVEIERYCRPEFEKWAEGQLTSCHRRARGKIAISNFIEWKGRDSGGYREDDLQVSWLAFKEAWLASNALVRRPTAAPATADQPDICPTCGINRNSPFPCEHPRLFADNGSVPDREAFWLVERIGHGQYIKDRSEMPGLTSDPWRAARFATEREAHDFWLRLATLRDECKPIEHVFINKAVPAEPQGARK